MANIISVVTVCFNSEKSIRDTFESVLCQTCTNFEYIVIDGNSKDGTVSIIKEYEPKFSDKGISFKWISEPDNGIYDAMKKGIKMSEGEFIGLLNSDDTYELDAIEAVLDVIKCNPGYDIYHGMQRFFMNGQEWMVRGTCAMYLEKCMIEHEACFVSKSTYEALDYFDEKYKYSADYDFMLRAKRSNRTFFFFEHIMVNFYDGGASWSSAAYEETQRIFEQYNLDNSSKLKRTYKRLRRKFFNMIHHRK